MSRFVRVVQIECNVDGTPLTGPDTFRRFAIVDRSKKNKTFFSSRTPDNTNERFNELVAAQIVSKQPSKEFPQQEERVIANDVPIGDESQEGPIAEEVVAHQVAVDYGTDITAGDLEEELLVGPGILPGAGLDH